jgi:hypothetical protein
MNRRRLVSLVALAAFILAAPLTALGGSPASVCPAGLTGSFPLCSIMPTFAGVNAESRLLPSGELGAETFLRTEDLTTYTEVDPGADITVAADTITCTAMDTRDSVSRVVKDLGTDFFSGDIEHRVKATVDAANPSNSMMAAIWGVGTTEDHFGTGGFAGEDAIMVAIYKGSFVWIRSFTNGGSTITNDEGNYTLVKGTSYYYKIKRVVADSKLYVYVYSDANFSTLVHTVEHTLASPSDTFRYQYALNTYDTGTASHTFTGTIEHLQLDTATYFDGNLVAKANGGEARFEPDGYLDEPSSENILEETRIDSLWDINTVYIRNAADVKKHAAYFNAGPGADGSVALSTDTIRGDSSARSVAVTVVDGSNGASDVQFYGYDVNFSITNGDDFVLSFWAKATESFIATASVHKNGTPYTNYGLSAEQFTFTTEWQKFSLPFTANADAADARYSILLGNQSGFQSDGITFYFDCLQVEARATSTSWIYTTSTAVTRPADSFSLTMTDAFKNKFAEALGSELAPDFGAVLGPELITDQQDRDFSVDADTGNWMIGESGSAASLDYDTSSIGGHDDKQIKLTAEAGEDYVLARLTTSYTPDMSAGYYILSAKVYLDPNADQDRIRLYASSFTGSTKIQSLDGAGSDYSTVNKGVWENVYSIFELVSGDLEGSFRIGFFDSGNLTANDICYFDDISLRKITFSDDWTAGTGWGPKFALTAPSLGDEELSNGDFSSVTEGSELVTGTDADFSGAGNWVDGGTLGSFDVNTTVAGKAYMLGDGGTEYMYRANTLTIGHQYRVTLKARLNAGASTDLLIGTDFGAADHYDSITPTGTETEFTAEFVASSGSIFIGSTAMNGIAFEIDDVSIKEITPTGLTISNQDANNYVEIDESAGTMRFVYDGSTTPALSMVADETTTVGSLYYISATVTDDSGGAVKVRGVNSVAYDKPPTQASTFLRLTSAGTDAIAAYAGTTEISVVGSGATDMTLSSISIKPYTPSHANTDPRFDRQTEGSDVLDGEGAFDAVGTWLEAPNASIGAGVLSCTGTGSISDNDNRTSINASLVEDVRYKITFDVTAYTSGQIRIDAGYDAEYLISSPAVQTYTIYLTCSGNSFFYIRVNGTLTIDNVAIVPVTLSDYTGTNWYPYDENGGAMHVAGSSAHLNQSVGSAGTYYLVNYKISSRTAGSVYSNLGGNTGSTNSTDGVYSEIVECGSNHSNVGVSATSTFDGTIDYLYIIPISDPVAHCTGSQSGNSTLYFVDATTLENASYKVVMTVDNYSTGGVTAVVNGNGVWGNRSADGTYTVYTGANWGNYANDGLLADADFTGDITALSVKEVTRHAKGTTIAVVTPSWDKADFTTGNKNILRTYLLYYHTSGGKLVSYDGTTSIQQAAYSYSAGTPMLLVLQYGDVISNVNYARVGAADLSSVWTSSAYGSDAQFDGAYDTDAGASDLLLFQANKFGSNNLRDLMFFDSILTDAEIENIRRRIK